MAQAVTLRQLTPTLVQASTGFGTGLVVGMAQQTNPAIANALTIGGLVGGLGLVFLGPRGMVSDVATGLAAGSGALLGHRVGRGAKGLTAAFRKPAANRETRMLASGGGPEAALQVTPFEEEELVTVL